MKKIVNSRVDIPRKERTHFHMKKKENMKRDRRSQRLGLGMSRFDVPQRERKIQRRERIAEQRVRLFRYEALKSFINKVMKESDNIFEKEDGTYNANLVYQSMCTEIQKINKGYEVSVPIQPALASLRREDLKNIIIRYMRELEEKTIATEIEDESIKKKVKRNVKSLFE